jgi:hypothetical protein
VRDHDERLNLELRASLGEAGLVEGQDGLWSDDDHAVVAVLTYAGIFVGWLDTEWDGPAWPVPKLQAVAHVPAVNNPRRRLRSAISKVRARRERALRTCRYCGTRQTPGHMHGDVCESCAARHLGVVH